MFMFCSYFSDILNISRPPDIILNLSLLIFAKFAIHDRVSNFNQGTCSSNSLKTFLLSIIFFPNQGATVIKSVYANTVKDHVCCALSFDPTNTILTFNCSQIYIFFFSWHSQYSGCARDIHCCLVKENETIQLRSNILINQLQYHLTFFMMFTLSFSSTFHQPQFYQLIISFKRHNAFKYSPWLVHLVIHRVVNRIS